jgi:hypothetical protein
VIDFGRVIYTYVTIDQAVTEGSRAAIRDSALLPTDADVEAAVKTHAVDVVLANPCPNGPIDPSTVPPPGSGWVYITDPNPPATAETLAQLSAAGIGGNAPGGSALADLGSPSVPAGCSATLPASGHVALQVSVRYNFVPFTPLLAQLTANSIVLSAASTYRTEY